MALALGRASPLAAGCRLGSKRLTRGDRVCAVPRYRRQQQQGASDGKPAPAQQQDEQQQQQHAESSSAASQPRRWQQYVLEQQQRKQKELREIQQQERERERQRLGLPPAEERDVDMTGGAGDYCIPEEEQPVGVRAARGLVAGIQAKWDGTTNKFEVVLYSLIMSAMIWAATELTTVIETVPFVPRVLRFVGLLVTGWSFWRYFVLEGGQDDLLEDLEELGAAIRGGALGGYMRAEGGASRPPPRDGDGGYY